jgi:hypothetical protein
LVESPGLEASSSSSITGGHCSPGDGCGIGGGGGEKSGWGGALFGIDKPIIKVGLPAPLAASELLHTENAEFFLACVPPEWPMWEFGLPESHGAGLDVPSNLSPGGARSDRGLPSLDEFRLT